MAEIISRHIVDEQVPFPMPEGVRLYLHPTGGVEPVLDTAGNDSYWANIAGYQPIPDPPPGHVYVVVTNGRQRYSYGARLQVELRTYPAPPTGEEWHVVMGRNGRMGIVVPDWCQTDVWNRTRAFGPSRFNCHNRCLFGDGCSECNPDVWAACIGHSCPYPESFRVPVEMAASGRCHCFEECGECSDSFAPYRLNWVHGAYNRICDDCLSNYFTNCEHCSSYIRDEEYDDHLDQCREDCSDECCYTDTSSYVHDYSYTPYFRFHGEGNWHMGLELELDTEHSHSGYDAANAVTEHFGNLVYLKEDTSIGEGFELVTHPMAFNYANKVDWSILDSLAEDHRVRATSSCGLHIHVSKTAFDTASHTYRWMRFIYRNAEPVQKLARRYDSEYASFDSYMNDWSIHYASMAKKGNHTCPPTAVDWYTRTPGGRKRVRETGLPSYTQRYAAINVENDDTLEMRFFASTTNPRHVRAAIQFAHASVEYTRQLTAHTVITQKGLDFETFREWLGEQNADMKYDALVAEIERLVP